MRRRDAETDDVGNILRALPTLTAMATSAPIPRWAAVQRQLIAAMDEAVPVLIRKFAERGGALYFAEDYDDLYEVCATWGLFYAIGGSEQVLDLALQQWNATTRISDQSIRHRLKHNEIPGVKKRFSQSGHREYYGLSHPGDAEWHHKGEGNLCLYDFGLCDPTITEQARRTRQFAVSKQQPALRFLRLPSSPSSSLSRSVPFLRCVAASLRCLPIYYRYY